MHQAVFPVVHLTVHLVVADCVSFAFGQVRKLTHAVAPPLPTKSFDFAGTHYSEAEIPDGRVCGDGAIFFVRFFQFVGLDLGLKELDGLGKLLRQVGSFAGFAGAVHPEPGGFHHHIAQNHFRVLHKVAVHADAVFIRVQLHPILLQIGDVISFLQKQYIAGDFCSGVLLECVVG